VIIPIIDTAIINEIRIFVINKSNPIITDGFVFSTETSSNAIFPALSFA